MGRPRRCWRGEHLALEEALQRLEARGAHSSGCRSLTLFTRRCSNPCSTASKRSRRSIPHQSPRLPFISNRTGKRIAEPMSWGRHWREHARDPVQFLDGVASLCGEGVLLFLELGPQPVLLAMARSSPHAPSDGMWLASLSKRLGDWQQMLESFAHLAVRGVPVQLEGLDQGYARRRVPLPNYPFQRSSFWFRPGTSEHRHAPAGQRALLGKRLSCAVEQRIFASEFAPDEPAYLNDHRVRGTAIFPATAFLELALEAARERGFLAAEISDASFEVPVVFKDDSPQKLQVVVNPATPQSPPSVQIFKSSLVNSEESWVLAATATIQTQGSKQAIAAERLRTVRDRVTHPVDVEKFYQQLKAVGLEYGPAFRGVCELYRSDGEALARIDLTEKLPQAAWDEYVIHPALLDACAHPIGVALGPLEEERERLLLLPAYVKRLAVFRPPTASVWSHVRLWAEDSRGPSGRRNLYRRRGVGC